MGLRVRVLNLSLRALTLIIKFVFVMSLAIFLPPAQVGLYGLITVTVSYSIYFIGFEFYTFSTRDLVARPRSEWSRLLSNQLVFFGLMYVVVLPAFSIVFFLEMLPWSVMAAFIALVVLEHLSTELMRLLVAIEKPLLATLVIFIKQALWSVCFAITMWLAPEFRNISDLLLFWIAGSALSILIGIGPLLKLDWKGALTKIDWRWIRTGAMIAIPLLLSSVAVRSLFTFDRYAFEALNSLALLGAYSVYMGVASAMLSFMESGVFVFYYPRMMKAYKEQNMSEFEHAYSKLAKQSAIWLTFLMVGAATAGVVVFPMLKETIYYDNLTLFFAIIVAMAIFIGGYVFQYGLYTTTRDKSIIVANIAGLAVAAIALVMIAPHSNYWAVTMAMTIGSGVATLLKYWKWRLTRKELFLA
jgi:O-antigen/teichoic acid export membrane protein